jgi:hypothetical protein
MSHKLMDGPPRLLTEIALPFKVFVTVVVILETH